MPLIFLSNKKNRWGKSKTNPYLKRCRYCAVSSITHSIVIVCKWVALCAIYCSPDARNRCRQRHKTKTASGDDQTKLGECCFAWCRKDK